LALVVTLFQRQAKRLPEIITTISAEIISCCGFAKKTLQALSGDSGIGFLVRRKATDTRFVSREANTSRNSFCDVFSAYLIKRTWLAWPSLVQLLAFRIRAAKLLADAGLVHSSLKDHRHIVVSREDSQEKK
jgi:hypothetical protein